jgi:prepilin-type N-terminal cleavage/methylation domain-containing protein
LLPLAEGVTLIEMVVVIAIIAVLASVIIESLVEVKKQAWRTECAGNLRALGNAFTFYATELGRYPDAFDRRGVFRVTGKKTKAEAPPKTDGFANIADLAPALIYHSLGDPRMLYCPTSLRTDTHTPDPFKKVSTPEGIKDQWTKGIISYFNLVRVTFKFPDASGRPTFDPLKESPHRNLDGQPLNHSNPRTVLCGDRTGELTKLPQTIAGSNHGREGGWFYYTSGDVQWRGWDKLTAHPAKTFVWYWPQMVNMTTASGGP